MEADERLVMLPKFVSKSLVKELERRGHGDTIVHVFRGPSAAFMSENTGTFGELEEYAAYRREHPGMCDRPALVTNNYNIGNILRQAKILGVDEGMIVPERLPRNFDLLSLVYLQPWTAHRLLWMLGAVPRDYLLKRKGH